jgi:hypothetical protein
MKQDIININQGEWFKHWFDSSFYHKLYANRDEGEAAGFVDELLRERSWRINQILTSVAATAGMEVYGVKRI